MSARPYRSSDAGALAEMAERSGFPYVAPDGPLIEACIVIADQDDKPVMAVAAKRMVELYGWFGPDASPIHRMAAIREAHGAMEPLLRRSGYSEASAFLPPSICQRFGRRLIRSFGWARNWESFCVKF